jgi:hypothetical protein
MTGCSDPVPDGTPQTATQRPRQMRLPYRRCTCPECGERFQTARADKRFCSASCKRRYWHKAEQRGAQVYDLLIRWRRRRHEPGGTKGILGQLAHIVDGWIQEDRRLRSARDTSRQP